MRDPAAAVPRRPGRPRSERARRALLDAAADLLEEQGFAAMTMDAVAARAGASKATLYRHWRSKAVLAMDAFMAEVDPQVPFPDTGDAVEDVRRSMRATTRLFGRGRVRQMLLGILGELSTNAELRAAFRERYVAPRREQGRLALRRGMDRGELSAELDPDVVFDALYGALYYRLLTDERAPSPRWSDRLVAQVFARENSPADR